ASRAGGIGRKWEASGAGARSQRTLDEHEQAAVLGCSLEAVHLTHRCELIDLHVDTFIPLRLWGYDPLARHRGGPFGRFFFGQLDLPRLLAGGLTGAMWSITTNPARPA